MAKDKKSPSKVAPMEAGSGQEGGERGREAGSGKKSYELNGGILEVKESHLNSIKAYAKKHGKTPDPSDVYEMFAGLISQGSRADSAPGPSKR